MSRGPAARWLRGVLAVVALGSGAPAAAQSAAAGPPGQAEPGAELRIAVLTMGVGAQVWERFGHNAIVVEDRARGTSIAYNFGMFSFQQEHFLLRFVQGRMLYWMEGRDTDWDVGNYVRRQRSVWRQELDLSPAERVAIRDFLAWNAQDEHKFYRYDYYLDNCSTRVRDVLDRVLGGAIERQMRMPGRSFRYHTARLNTHNPLLYAGLMLALGATADQPRTRWDEMFLPLKLREYLREVRLPDSAGGYRPLVKSERALFESDRYQARAEPPGWLPGSLAIGGGIGLLLAWLGTGYARSGRGWLRFLVPAVAYALLTGIAGAVLAGMWAFTDHVAAARNENALQVTVLALALAVLLPWATPEGRGTARLVRGLAWLVGGLSVLGLLLKLLPFSHQVNGQVLALLVPANLGLMVGVLAVTRGARRGA